MRMKLLLWPQNLHNSSCKRIIRHTEYAVHWLGRILFWTKRV